MWLSTMAGHEENVLSEYMLTLEKLFKMSKLWQFIFCIFQTNLLCLYTIVLPLKAVWAVCGGGASSIFDGTFYESIGSNFQSLI